MDTPFAFDFMAPAPLSMGSECECAVCLQSTFMLSLSYCVCLDAAGGVTRCEDVLLSALYYAHACSRPVAADTQHVSADRSILDVTGQGLWGCCCLPLSLLGPQQPLDSASVCRMASAR